ncbi:MAG: hypothetical protein II938_01130 [Alphaproteobacteria bacterium]|nr:hypothetical protein [Alphaproteobacteria bacterium]
MTTIISEAQRISNVRFERIVAQPDMRWSQQALAMAADPRATIHNFYLFKQTVSPGKIQQRRNELARIFTESLKHNDWSLEQSSLAAPIVDWMLSLKKGRNIGGYLKVMRPLVLLACNKLQLPEEQKRAWKKAVTPKVPTCPRGLGEQSATAIPRPVLRGVHLGE